MENQDISSNAHQQEIRPPVSMKKKPLGLSLLLIFAAVFNGLLFILMLAGLFYNDVVLNILQQYYKHLYISPGLSFMFILVGALISGISLFGLILLWLYKRSGIYFYIPAQLTMLVLLVFVLKSYDYTNIGIAVVVMIIFGIYAKEMNTEKTSKISSTSKSP